MANDRTDREYDKLLRNVAQLKVATTHITKVLDKASDVALTGDMPTPVQLSVILGECSRMISVMHESLEKSVEVMDAQRKLIRLLKNED